MKRIILKSLLFIFLWSCSEDEFSTPQVAPVVCEETTLLATGIPFIENFEEEFVNWIQVVEASDRYWELDNRSGNGFLNLSAFRPNNTPASVYTWLISPQLDFDKMTEKMLSFKIADAFQNGNPLHLYVSMDYDGKQCPTDNYTWVEIGEEALAKLINNSNLYNNVFESTDNISLENFQGKGVVAIVYQSESTISTTIQLDDIVIGKKVEKQPDIIPELVEKTLPYEFKGGSLLVGNLLEKDTTGSLKWETFEDSFIRASGFNTNEKNTLYLVTPRFDFDLQEREFLTFDTQDIFDNGKVLNLYYSNDFDGMNYETTVWNLLEIPNQSDGDGEDTTSFINSEIIDLSFIEGKAVLAFQYISDASEEGNKPGPTTLLTLANIQISFRETYPVLFSEIADPKDNVRARFVELYNSGDKEIDLTNWKLNKYKNGNINPEVIKLSGTILPKSYYVIANNEEDYKIAYPNAPLADVYSTKITGNGDDAYELIEGIHRVDMYGEIEIDGTGEDWEYTDSKAVRNTMVLLPSEMWILNEWTIEKANTEDLSPGEMEKPINNKPIVNVFITGELEIGKTLLADISESVDEDGDDLIFEYQWYRSEDSNGEQAEQINNATMKLYEITTEDENKYISVQVIASDGKDKSEAIFSEYVGKIAEITFVTEGLFISEIADPNNNTQARFVELYNSNEVEVDLTNYKLKRYTNSNIEITNTATLTLSGTIEPNNTFTIAVNSAEFEKVYGFIPNQNGDGKGAVDSNGDDQIILEDPKGVQIDIFGVIGEDGSETNHEFEDGRANRKQTVLTGNVIYNFSEWDIWNDTGANGTVNLPQNAPEDFTPGER